jgi:hypothetical protein
MMDLFIGKSELPFLRKIDKQAYDYDSGDGMRDSPICVYDIDDKPWHGMSGTQGYWKAEG